MSFLGRVLAIAAALVTMCTGLAGSAGAAPSPSVAGPAFECELEGNSFHARICVDLRLQNGYVTCGEQGGNAKVLGHVRIWGPGGMRAQSVDDIRPSVCGHGIGRGQTCVEFMKYLSPGNYASWGLACKNI